MGSDAARKIAALARAGKQQAAIAAATEALAAQRLAVAARLALLDLRAESLIAEGRFHDAARDAAGMLALTAADAPLAHRVLALMREAVVLMRLSEHKRALLSAEQAEVVARQGRDKGLHACKIGRAHV
jgi:hypothetical protein